VPLPAIDGLNVEAGLATAGGNRGLYHRLLVRFGQSEKDFTARFRAAHGEPETHAAERCAHTLKGVAATIGAFDVSAAAATLEGACKDCAPPATLEAALDRVAEALGPMIDALGTLENLADPVPDGSRGAGVGREAVRDLLSRLRERLEDDDTEATEIMETLLAHPAVAPHREALRHVCEALHEFDFPSALAALGPAEKALAAMVPPVSHEGSERPRAGAREVL